jgi:hypothetical protein
MIKISDAIIDKDLRKFAEGYSNIVENYRGIDTGIAVDFAKAANLKTEGMQEIPEEFRDCLALAPKGIRDLKDGVSIETYEFEKGNEAELGFLGFANLSISNKEKITVIEYMQYGSVLCKNKMLKYGVGCRLMLRIRKHKRGAKLNTPQQITASVIFDKAEVSFSMRTFGITGKGVARLNQAGTFTENTYTNFMTEVSNLIVDIYSNDSDYIILPQPLFFK